jgi:tetratricopeptide (TPR) repeat protein
VLEFNIKNKKAHSLIVNPNSIFGIANGLIFAKMQTAPKHEQIFCSQNPKSKILLVPLLVVALSLALNLHDLAGDSLWGDEIFTATFANRSPAEVIAWTAGDIHPPLYYLWVGGFARLVVPLGESVLPGVVSDWLWRFPSVVAGVLAVAVTYRLAEVMFLAPLPLGEGGREGEGLRWPATAAALLLAVAPVAIKYGQEARMHALFMALSALSTWLLFRAMARPERWSRWLAFALATTANLYTVYFGFLILAAQAGLVGLSAWGSNPRLSRSSRLKPTLAVGLVGLLYGPWWPVLWGLLRKRAEVGAIEGGVGSPAAFAQGVVRALGPAPEAAAWGFMLLFILGLILLVRRCWPLAAFAWLWLALPTLLPIFLGDPRALQFRYAFILPVYLAVVAISLTLLRPQKTLTLTLSQRKREQESVSPRPGGEGPATEGRRVYLLWLLATLSFIATLGVYHQTKPGWRQAAAYLNDHAAPDDIILAGPLWDEERFIGYYYRGPAQILTSAAMVTNIHHYAERMRAGGGRVWAVNRFPPEGAAVAKNIPFTGIYLSEPQLAVYEPALLTEAALDLARQAVEAAYPWAAAAESQGVLNPDPRTAKAAALRALGDTLMAAGRPAEAIEPYQTAVEIFPGWVSSFVALAEAQEEVGNLPAAVAAYRQAVAFNPKWQGPPAEEAATLAAAGQWEAALQQYHDIIGE